MVLWSLGSAASKLRRISWIYLESGTVARRRTFDKQNSNRLDFCVCTHIRHYTTNIQEWSWYCEVECWNWMKSESLVINHELLIITLTLFTKFNFLLLEFYELRWMHHLSENIENLISVLVVLRMSWERSWTGLALSSIAAFRASKPPTGRSRVRKFRFGQDDDEEDIDYNLRLLDVPGFICSWRYFKRCSEGSCCFVPFRILSGIFNNFLHLFTKILLFLLLL